MVKLSELAPRLSPSERNHLGGLMRVWDLLADISFADLLLCVPENEEVTATYTVVGHVRPTTSRSIYRSEMEGHRFVSGERLFFDLARETGQVIDGGLILQVPVERIRTLSVPVVFEDKVIAVLARDFSPDEERMAGDLEMTYFFLFRRIARMIAEGSYPFPITASDTEISPRVSDGLLMVDEQEYVRFASPNSVSVLSRFGIRQVEGQKLESAGMPESAIGLAFSSQVPQLEEVHHNGKTVIIKCLPILEGEKVTGGLVLVRDISELRRRDRLLLSKDATIAEIHHRVKNNLQTISSLLRLQGRRVVSDEASRAIEESVRRIRSIAIVHEILSQEPSNDVGFEDIMQPLVRLVSENFTIPDQQVAFEITGEIGPLSSSEATTLAVVLNELMQNAIEHGFGGSLEQAPVLIIQFEEDSKDLLVTLVDNGIGVSADFSLEQESGLGLTIVRNLVEIDLQGTIQVFRGETRGTVVQIRLPKPPEPDSLRNF
ncbi:MAG: sensor histidine kinase [Acidimicrobiales bacterium]|nr:sensor histidine kinase [Acidimicrobiales bacterium]